jgi:hypothetical protein
MRNPKQVVATLAAAAIMTGGVVTMTMVSNAASPSQTQCESAGGTFSRTNGSVSCVYPVVSDPVGNSESSGGQSQTVDTQTTTGGQGNSGNKATKNDTCAGPGNSLSGC